MSTPVASVIIGVYNRAHQIGECVESLLASTFRDFELVLIDDGSKDDSVAVLRQLEQRDARIRVLVNARNRGASGTRNVGMETARGEILLFCDSDCIVEPDWIERMVAGMQESGAAAASGVVRDPAPRNLTERTYAGTCLIAHKAPVLVECNMALRASLGYRFDEAIFYGEGDDLALRLRVAGHTIGVIPDARVLHNHPLDFDAYMRIARTAGRGHTCYWYKHGQILGRDLIFGGLGLATLPLGLVDVRLLAVPALFLSLQLAAMLFAELFYKRKPLGEALTVFPILSCYYAVRLSSALRTWANILTGRLPGIVESKRRWRAEQAGRAGGGLDAQGRDAPPGRSAR
jgi:glycosyltransferase involved in cell wall biosynthesis